MGETKLVAIRLKKKCNSNVAELSRRSGMLAIGRQDRVTTLTFASEVILVVEKKAFRSHQSFLLHYWYIFLWWTTSADMAFDNIYAEQNTALACCLNGDVSDNKFYYNMHACHEQQFKAYKDKDEVVVLTMTLFT